MISPVSYMMLGAISLASIIAGAFFLRFWKNTRDRFFLFFALSFLLEGINRFVLGMQGALNEDYAGYYLIRLLAYGLILVAILDKNIPPRKKK